MEVEQAGRKVLRRDGRRGLENRSLRSEGQAKIGGLLKDSRKPILEV